MVVSKQEKYYYYYYFTTLTPKQYKVLHTHTRQKTTERWAFKGPFEEGQLPGRLESVHEVETKKRRNEEKRTGTKDIKYPRLPFSHSQSMAGSR
jgi:hypothetical protein